MEKEIIIFGLIWIFLLIASLSTRVVLILGTGYFSFYLTSLLIKVYLNLRPRKYIPVINNKSVLITGCDSGFGAALAERLCDIGFTVYAGCLFPDGPGAQKLKSNYSNVKILKLNVTKDEDVVAAFQVVKKGTENGERLWAIVNNAGIGVFSEIELCPMEMYDKIFQVNALGVVRVTKTFLPLLRKTKNSRVVNVVSSAGRMTPSEHSAYCMSKYAAISFSDSLRIEMKKWNITVHTIEPVLYNTDLVSKELHLKNFDDLLKKCPEEIKKSYGDEYFESYRKNIHEWCDSARPLEKICEVVDDMVDAVAGDNPKVSYVPGTMVEHHIDILKSLPISITDKLMSKNLSKVKPFEA